MHIKTLMPVGVYLFPIHKKDEMDEMADNSENVVMYMLEHKISAFKIGKLANKKKMYEN